MEAQRVGQCCRCHNWCGLANADALTIAVDWPMLLLSQLLFPPPIPHLFKHPLMFRSHCSPLETSFHPRPKRPCPTKWSRPIPKLSCPKSSLISRSHIRVSPSSLSLSFRKEEEEIKADSVESSELSSDSFTLFQHRVFICRVRDSVVRNGAALYN